MKHCKPVDVAQLIAEHERRINAMGGPRAYAERVHAASDAARAQQKSLSSEPTSEVEAYVRVAFVQLIEMDAEREPDAARTMQALHDLFNGGRRA